MFFENSKIRSGAAELTAQGAAANRYSLHVHRGLEGFHKVEAVWLKLASQMVNKAFWHYPQYYESYLQALESQPQMMLFFVLFKGPEAIALLPLKQRRMQFIGIPLDVLELPRHTHLKLKDIIFPEPHRSPDSLRALLSGLCRIPADPWDCLLFSDVVPGSGALALLKQARLPTLIEKKDTCDYLRLEPSYEEFFKKRSKGLRKNLRVYNKRAAAAGLLQPVFVRNPTDLPRALEIFLELEASGWKGRNGQGSAIRLNRAFSDFYRSLVAGFGEQGACEITLLYLNQQPIAANLGLIVRDTLYCLKIAYDETFSGMSPGNLQWEKIIGHHIAAREVKYVNLLSGDASEWHRRWQPLKWDTFNGLILRRRPKPLALYALKLSKRVLNASSGGIGSMLARLRRAQPNDD